MDQSFSWVILIPIWGDSHIRMCANYLLPSLLASGNLPAISNQTAKPTIRFLTTKPSSATLQNLSLVDELKEYAEINFCYIDDLVNIGNYGFTLTIAYERGIQSDAPQEQVNNRYIFLNGDFVLSNNCFASLNAKLSQGYNAIVCPSLRVNEHDVIPLLDHLKDKHEVLDAPSRDLVRLSLDHLHPTVVSAMVNKSQIGTSISHQYFARASNDVLLARFFLLFMFCIKPEKPLQSVTAHCDYSFVPEMCPSGNFTLITDSDESFLMELSPLEQESNYIYLGAKDLHSDTNRMQKWVTAEHAKYSTQTIYFHSKDLNKESDEVKSASNSLNLILDKLHNQLATSQRASHKFHPFWNNYLNVLKSQGQLLDRSSIIKQTGPIKRLINWCTQHVLGFPPFVRPLHYKYRDYLNCLAVLNSVIKPDPTCKVLYVCGDNKNLFNMFFERKENVTTETIRIDDLVNMQNLKEYNLIFIEANQSSFNKFARHLLDHRIPTDLKFVVFIDLINAAWQHNNITPYLCLLNDKIPTEFTSATNAKQKWLYYKSSVNFMHELYGTKKILRMLLNLGIFSYIALYIAYVNLFKNKQPNSNKLENLSSIVLNFK